MVPMSDLVWDQPSATSASAARSGSGSESVGGAGNDPPPRPSNGVAMASYDYGLPEEAIAQRPVEPRSAARLLVAPGLADGDLPTHTSMADLPEMLGPGDVLVLNDTRVLAARLLLSKASGGRAEVLLLEPIDRVRAVWEALVRPGRRLPESTHLYEPGGGPPVLEVGERVGGPETGRRLVRLLDPAVVDRAGIMPLPPYIHASLGNPDRYQTVYSRPGQPWDRSAAAPTAGLHFTPELIEECCAAGARLVRLDLTIGLDTFRPITALTTEGHVIHSERYSVPAETMAACAGADRVIAVGTTAIRALESAACTGVLSGRTSLYIHGEYRFRVVDLLVTNFHLPRSSLLLLVESFCGPVWRGLYATALAEGYRFLSFGDAMVVERRGAKGEPVPIASAPAPR